MGRVLDGFTKKRGSGWYPDDLASDAEAPPPAKKGAKKGRQRMVWWNEDQERLAFDNNFFKPWITHYVQSKIIQQVDLASQWLLKRPARRTPGRNLELFLKKWLNKGLGEGEQA